jgi:hypothetical protein
VRPVRAEPAPALYRNSVRMLRRVAVNKAQMIRTGTFVVVASLVLLAVILLLAS